jgi:uncharacterized phiE125 gp8 family phage protein
MDAIMIAPPAAEPVSLAEAKAWLRVDTTSEDAAIASLIGAARDAVEQATNRRLVTQSWRIVVDAWPFTQGADGSLALLATRPSSGVREVALRIAPLVSVTAVRVYDSGGQPQILAASMWRLVGALDRRRLLFNAAPPAPGVPAGGIEIDVVAGFGAAGDVPAPLRQAVLELVAQGFENRGDADAQTGLPKRVAMLLAPWRRGRLA